MVGRPVRFVGAEAAADDAYAVARLRKAFEKAGYERRILGVWMLVAAAYHYESTLDHDELLAERRLRRRDERLLLLRVGPGVRQAGPDSARPAKTAALDWPAMRSMRKIVRNLVSPRLGAGTMAQSMNKVLPAVPNWVYFKLERWHHLSFLRSNSTMNMLRTARAQAFEPEKIEALINLVEEDLGYQLHRAVQQVKRWRSKRS